MATPEEERLRRLLELLGEPAPMSTDQESDLLFGGPPSLFPDTEKPFTPAPRPTPKPTTPTTTPPAPVSDLTKTFQELGFKVPSAGPATTPAADNTDLFKQLGFNVPPKTPETPATPTPVIPVGPGTTTMPRSGELIKAQEAAVQAASVGPFGEVNVPAEQRALAATEDILSQDYTTGGEPQDYWFDLAPYVPRTPYENVLGTLTSKELTDFGRSTAADIEAAGGSVFSALRPQVIAPKFAEQQEQFDYTIKQTIENIKSLSKLDPTERQAQGTALKEFWKDQPEVTSKIDQILSGTIEAGDLDNIISEIETAAKEAAPEKSWFLTEDAGGRLVESTPLWLLRLLNAPVAAVAGGIEGTITSLTNAASTGEFSPSQVAGDIVNSMTRYIREGRSFTDVASQTLGSLGRVADEQLFGPEAPPELEAIGAGVGGVAGFAADILTGPTDIAGLAGRAARGIGTAAAKGAAKVLPEVVKAPITGIAKQVIDKAAGVSPTPVAAVIKAAGGDLVKLEDIKIPAKTQTAPGTVEVVPDLGEDTLSQVVKKQKEVLVPTVKQADGTLTILRGPLEDFASDATSAAGRAATPIVKASGILDNIPEELVQREITALTNNGSEVITAAEFKALDETDRFNIAASSVINKALSDIPIERGQQLQRLVEQNATQNILREIKNSSYRQTAKIASTLTRITPGRFVVADAVKPIIDAASENVQKLWRQVEKDGQLTQNFEFIGEGEYRLGKQVFTPTQTIDTATFKNVLDNEISKVIDSNKIAYIPATRLERVIAEISSGSGRAAKTGRVGRIRSAARALASEINITPIRNIFTPKEIQPSIVGAVANAIGRLAVGSQPVGPLTEFVSSVTNGWGSIFDSFKKEAAAAKNYSGVVDEAGRVVVPPRVLKPEEVYSRVIFKDPGRYFDEYINMLYGATDDFAEVYKGLTSSIGMVGDKKTLVQLLKEVSNDHLAIAKAEFVDNYALGKFNEAFDTLRKVHFYLADRPLGTMVSTDNASLADKIRLIKARISPNDFMKTSSITWARIKQADILESRIEEFALKNPEAFLLPNEKWFEEVYGDYSKRVLAKYSNVDARADALASVRVNELMESDEFRSLSEAQKQAKILELEALFSKAYKYAIRDSQSLLTVLRDFPNIIQELAKAEVSYTHALRLSEQLGTAKPKPPLGFYAILQRRNKRFIAPKGFKGKDPVEANDAIQVKVKALKERQSQLVQRLSEVQKEFASKKKQLRKQLDADQAWLSARKASVSAQQPGAAKPPVNTKVFIEEAQRLANVKALRSELYSLGEQLTKKTSRLQEGISSLQQKIDRLVPTSITWEQVLRENEKVIIQNIKKRVDEQELLDIKRRFAPYQEVLTPFDNLPYNEVLERYITILDPELQAGLNRAFVNSPVIKTPQEINNIAAFIKGSLTTASSLRDSTSVIDILNKVIDLEKTGMAKKLVEASDVRSLSSTLQDIILPINRTEIPEDDLIKLNAALDMSFKELQQLPVPVRERALSLFSVMGDALTRANNFAKTGVLSGFLVPNLGYMMDNALTLPLITLSTLGEKVALKTLGTSIAGLPGLAIKNFTTNGSKVFKALLGSPQVPRETVLQLGGKAYSVGELVDAVVENSVLATRLGSEISSTLVDDMIAYSGRTAGAEVASTWKNIFERELGGIGKRGNFLSKVSEAVDKYWRINVFVNALEAGSNITEASRLARESLFDYGSLTKFERETLTKYIWFYTFWSRNLLNTFNILLSAPDRLAKLYRIQKATRQDPRSYERDYAQSKMFRVLLEKDGQQVALVGPTIPGIDGFEELLSYGGGFLNLAAAAASFDLNSVRNEADKVFRTGMAIPLTKASLGYRTALSYLYGQSVQEDGTVRDLPNYLDPKFTWWLQQNPEIWKAFTNIVPVEVEQNVKPGPSYYGLQYKVKPGSEGTWFLFQQALVYAALNRNMRDYAEVLDPFIGRGGLPSDTGSFQTESSSGLEWFGRASGILSPVPTMTEEERRLRIIKDQERRMKALSGE